MYSDSVTFAYNSQVHATTGLKPFELVLSRPPPPLSIELAAPPVGRLRHREAKFRWLNLLNTLLLTQKVVSAKARDRYKRNFDARLRSISHHPVVGGYVYLRRNYATAERGATRKLAPSANGPYVVRELRDTHVVIQRGDSLERASLDRIAPAPAPVSQPT